MIKIQQSTDTRLEIRDHIGPGCWIDVTNPTSEEVSQLAQELDIPQSFIVTPLKRDEIPRIEKLDHALLIHVLIPHFQGANASVPYVARAMGIIVTEKSVATVCRYKHNLLRELPYEHQVDLSTLHPARFVLHLLWNVANTYIVFLNEIEKTVEKLEDRLQRSLQNREVIELLRYQKSLVHFTTALHATQMMLDRLHQSEALKLEPADKDLLDEVFTEYQQAFAMSQIATDILSQMMDAFASIIANNLNVVMKFMAAIAVILVIPTIIATFYGMNISLPLQEHPATFGVLFGLSLGISLIIGFIFWKKHWL